MILRRFAQSYYYSHTYNPFCCRATCSRPEHPFSTHTMQSENQGMVTGGGHGTQDPKEVVYSLFNTCSTIFESCSFLFIVFSIHFALMPISPSLSPCQIWAISICLS